VPEDEYGYWDSGSGGGSRARGLGQTIASNEQLGKLTDVLHSLGIVRQDDKLQTLSALLEREITNMRCIHMDEAEDLLQRLGVA
jgi:hypothetical protein